MKSAVAVLVVCVSLAPRASDACAPAPPPGHQVHIAEEQALIVWDEATKTQHFIRRAAFVTDVSDFGFLVPTPTKPQLGETEAAVFERLEAMVRPELRHESHVRLAPFFLVCLPVVTLSKSATAIAPVRVLETARVAGYDAVVLEADDPGALAEWLKSHGYAQRPALEAWLAPYVAQHWKLTAFKIADPKPGAARAAVSSSVVHMTFTTDRPFFPYREPTDQREGARAARSLRLFFVGASRVMGTIGDGATAFQGTTWWAGPLDAAAKLPVSTPAGAWLTVIDDRARPRPGVDELWLAATKEQRATRPPPDIVEDVTSIPIPVDGLVVVVAVVFVISVRRRSARPS